MFNWAKLSEWEYELRAYEGYLNILRVWFDAEYGEWYLSSGLLELNDDVLEAKTIDAIKREALEMAEEASRDQAEFFSVLEKELRKERDRNDDRRAVL